MLNLGSALRLGLTARCCQNRIPPPRLQTFHTSGRLGGEKDTSKEDGEDPQTAKELTVTQAKSKSEEPPKPKKSALSIFKDNSHKVPPVPVLDEAQEDKYLRVQDVYLENYKNTQGLIKTHFVKPFESTYETTRPIKDPFERVIDQLKPKKYRKTKFVREDFKYQYDMAIIGGGLVGLCVAYHLSQRIRAESLELVVIERDPSVSRRAFRHWTESFIETIIFAVSSVRSDILGRNYSAAV